MTVRRIAALGALVLTLTASQPAAAHVRVTPAKAAPGDRVHFELIVPGETRAHTIEVALRIPDGIRPSSFDRVPGWHRQLDKAAPTAASRSCAGTASSRAMESAASRS
jgi:uncharacterized protein YcnI